MQDVDPATLPDADTVETQLLAAQQNGEAQGAGTGGKPGKQAEETPFLILRWPPFVGQVCGLDKLVSGFGFQAAS